MNLQIGPWLGQSSGSCHSCVTPGQAPSSLPEPQHATPPARRWNLDFLSQFLPHSPISLCPFRLQASPTPHLQPSTTASFQPQFQKPECALTRSGQDQRLSLPTGQKPLSLQQPCCLSRAAGHSRGERMLRVAARASLVWWLGGPSSGNLEVITSSGLGTPAWQQQRPGLDSVWRTLGVSRCGENALVPGGGGGVHM